MTDRRSVELDQLGDRTGIRVEFYDPLGTRYGFPTFPYHCAPAGLATVRQLRAAGLRPGGHDPVAQIYWRHRRQRRVAYLYRLDLAAPKRTATPAQQAAIAKALPPAAPAASAARSSPTTSPAATANATTATKGTHRELPPV